MLNHQGRLWQRIVSVTEQALSSRALLPIPTEYEFVEDSGIRFFVRRLSGLLRKDEAKEQQIKESFTKGKEVDPFLPYEESLFVADISETHLAVLNKYNVLDHHLLIITRAFEDQEMLLTLNDFQALWGCMSEYNALGFYNGGEAGGASQKHKHLQMVPLPLAPEGPQVPIGPLLEEAKFEGNFGTVPAFIFQHVFVHYGPGLYGAGLIESPSEAAKKTFDLYCGMLQKVGMTSPDTEVLRKQSGPYCLLITRDWMLLVPRSKEFFDSISVNSLGFAGALLVRNEEQMQMVKTCGPMHVLREVGLPVSGKIS